MDDVELKIVIFAVDGVFRRSVEMEISGSVVEGITLVVCGSQCVELIVACDDGCCVLEDLDGNSIKRVDDELQIRVGDKILGDDVNGGLFHAGCASVSPIVAHIVIVISCLREYARQ